MQQNVWKNIGWKLVLIVIIVGLCGLALLYKPIRLGKDLRGGVSLIYSVRTDENDPDKLGTLNQTIAVLKDRVNPRGVLDISMQPLGVDRIEVVMPLPTPEVLALRRAFDQALSALLAEAQIPEDELDEAVRTNQAVQRFGGEAERGSRVTTLQAAYNARADARRALDEAVASGAAPDVLAPLESAVALAELEYDRLLAEVHALSLSESEIRRALALSTTQEPERDAAGSIVTDAATGETTMRPSPRQVEIDELKSRLPHLAARIDSAVGAYDTYQASRTSFDDPEDLIRLLRGAGVLEFHIAVNSRTPLGVNIDDMRTQLAERGPENTDSPVAAWFPINELKQWYETPEQLAQLKADPNVYFDSQELAAAEHDGRYYLLLYISDGKSMTHTGPRKWSIKGTRRDVDELGRDAVAFELDSAGGALMNRLTGPHVGEQMAIVLDGEVYSAPNLLNAIGNRGQIQGRFSERELSYLIRVLAAGSLEARLSERPIAVNTLGPSLGADNLSRGLKAFTLSIIVTVLIMLAYYFFAGVVANIALACNAVIIFGVMAAIDGTFTLPGLAGIALSIAMAVDANVLIYERIREELVNNREDLRTAIRLGYQRAMSAIVDGNITGLISCFVLLYTATTEVKGFALTMILGVLATLFTALFITRVLFTIYTDVFRARTLPMLPTFFPGIHRALEPKINWISKRFVFITVSAAACIASVVMAASRGSEMLDTEFRGGLSMTMRARMAREGEARDAEGRLLLLRPEVEAEIHGIGDAATDPNSPVAQLRNASVLTVGELTGDFRSSRFQIKVAVPTTTAEEATITDEVVEAIVGRFGDRLDITPALTFGGSDQAESRLFDHSRTTFPINANTIGEVLGRPELTNPVERFRGGVAVLISDIRPPVTTADARARLDRLRDQPDFARDRGRDVAVIGLEPVDPADPSKGYTALAALVHDKDLRLQSVDFDRWDNELASREWRLACTALARGASLQEISSFSPAVARTLAANAVVAVILSLIGMLVYIWMRFGSLRYSLATIIAVAHNVIICVGALALTHWLAGTGFASLIMLDAFHIDLNVIAALLTIIGYSLNDTIVILDRIRENRGKRQFATPEVVNRSINQTFSRTVLTGGSTILASIILYVLGGTGIQAFAYTFLIGLIVGTYSSVTIAAPLVILKAGRSATGASAASGWPSGESSMLEAGKAEESRWAEEPQAAST